MAAQRPPAMADPAAQPAHETAMTPYRYVEALALAVILPLYSLAVLWSATVHGPASDELRHLASGIVHWRHGSFAPYRVNPPLVRMIASLPAIAHPAARAVGASRGVRPEGWAARQLSERAGAEAVTLLQLGRLMTLPLLLPGIVVAYVWARELRGSAAGLIAATLFATSPAFLNASTQIRSDAAAASLGLCAMFAWHRWSRAPSYRRALLAGAVFGLSLLCKFTMLLLLVPVVLLLALKPAVTRTLARRHRVGQGAVALLAALWVVNAGYAFQGVGVKLGTLTFQSGLFRQTVDLLERHGWLAWLARVPLPLPEDFVLGIDIQQVDFERGNWTYCAGAWWFRGPWYAYVYLVVTKEPVPHLAALAVGLFGWWRRSSPTERLCLWLPGLLIFTVASMKSSLVYFRYVLPGLAFWYVGAGAVVGSVACRWWKGLWVVGGIWIALSVGRIAPHWESYANELIGGPWTAYRYVSADAALEDGQDTLPVVRWLRDHPDVVPDGAVLAPERAALFAVLQKIPRPPVGPSGPPSMYAADRGPKPGTYVIWLPAIVRADAAWAYFRYLEPACYITPTVAVYKLGPDDVSRLLARMRVGPSPREVRAQANTLVRRVWHRGRVRSFGRQRTARAPSLGCLIERQSLVRSIGVLKSQDTVRGTLRPTSSHRPVRTRPRASTAVFASGGSNACERQPR